MTALEWPDGELSNVTSDNLFYHFVVGWGGGAAAAVWAANSLKLWMFSLVIQSCELVISYTPYVLIIYFDSFELICKLSVVLNYYVNFEF